MLKESLIKGLLIDDRTTGDSHERVHMSLRDPTDVLPGVQRNGCCLELSAEPRRLSKESVR